MIDTASSPEPMPMSVAARAWSPILGGPLAGMRWAPAARGKTLRILMGTYEREQTAHFVSQFKPGSILFDVGAHVGYYTLLGARLGGVGGRVYAFEPHPRNASFLRRHLKLNRLTNVKLFEGALGAVDGVVRFAPGKGSATGRVEQSGSIVVEARRLDDIARRENAAPTHIKIDVEGAELDVLQGARETFARFRPVVFLSTHNAKVHAACQEWLSEMGYSALSLLADNSDHSAELFCSPVAAPRRAAA